MVQTVHSGKTHATIACSPHLDRVLGEVELVGQLAPLGPADVVLLDELLLEPPDLLPGEGSAVPPDVVQGRLLRRGVPARARRRQRLV